jgi:hypothetical protein
MLMCLSLLVWFIHMWFVLTFVASVYLSKDIDSFFRSGIHRAESVNSSDKMIVKMTVSRENLQFNLDSRLWMGQRFIVGRHLKNLHTYVSGNWAQNCMCESWVFTLRPSSSLYINSVGTVYILWGSGCILIYIVTGVCCIHIFRRIVLIIM